MSVSRSGYYKWKYRQENYHFNMPRNNNYRTYYYMFVFK